MVELYLTGWWFGTSFIFPYIGNNHPNRLSYFSEGWPNHQAEMVMTTAQEWEDRILQATNFVGSGGPTRLQDRLDRGGKTQSIDSVYTMTIHDHSCD